MNLSIIPALILLILPSKSRGWFPKLVNEYGSWYNPKSYVCNLAECCDHHGIPAKFNELERLLDHKVYGQHLARDIVLSSLRSHWDPDYEPQKALTLSFHGWPGGGKNYITKFIAQSLFHLGSKSKFVHHYIGRIHFPKEELVQSYQFNLYKEITENVTKCPKQLFVFDEVDKMPAGLLDIIKPLIDYRDHVEGVDFRYTIFIFLSNTGSHLINDHVLKLWKEGRRRESLKLKDFENLISLGAFNEKGGFYKSDNIKSNLIDHYIPFLPMEIQHVKLCIQDEFKTRNYTASEYEIREAMEFIEWGPDPEHVYSKTGCKRLSQKVGMIVNRIKAKPIHNEL